VRLATVAAGRRLNASAPLVSALDELDRFEDLRHEMAALPDDAPFATAGEGFLSSAPNRSIAPGFPLMRAGAEAVSVARAFRPVIFSSKPRPQPHGLESPCHRGKKPRAVPTSAARPAFGPDLRHGSRVARPLVLRETAARRSLG
jgi:hypothetical protein